MSESTKKQIDQAYRVVKDELTRAYTARSRLSGVDLGSSVDSPQDLLDNLRLARQIVDQLESVLVDLLRLKATVSNFKASCEGAVEDAEVEQSKDARVADFVSARDRSIEVNVKTISQRRVLREAIALYTEVAASVNIVQTMHRGADSHRRDIETRLRAITLITSLER